MLIDALTARHEILHLRRARVRGAHQDEEAASLGAAAREEGLDRVPSEVGAERHGVRIRAGGRACAEVRIRVRLRGRTDVAALDVANDEEAAFLRRAQCARIGGHAGQAERLVEGDLHLHGGHHANETVEHVQREALVGAREARQRTARGRGRARGEQVRPRVDAGRNGAGEFERACNHAVGEVVTGHHFTRQRKFWTILCPQGVMKDSGWNWIP